MGMQLTKTQLEGMIGEQLGKSLEQFKKDQDERQKAHQDSMAEFFAEITAKSAERDGHRRESGVKLGSWIKSIACGRNNPELAARHCADKLGDKITAKALAESVFADGGAMVPEVLTEEIIELLRPKVVMRRLGVRSVPMVGGSLNMPYVSTGASASYVGENSNIAASQQTLGQLNLTAKKLAVITPISNDLLQDTSGRADAFVRDDLIAATAQREDLAMIRDDGTQNKPTGMLFQAPAANKNNSTGTSVAQKTTDLTGMVRRLEEANVDMVNPAWVVPPRAYWNLWADLDANSNPVWRDELKEGVLFGMPIARSNQIPTNIGGANTEIYLADFFHLILGEALQMQLRVFEGGAYHDGSSVVSGISQDQSVVRLIERHDFGARQRGQEIQVLEAVAW